MRKEEVSNIIESLIPKLYGYAYALCASDSDAEQLITDAYTIFVIQESNNLEKMDIDNTDQKSRLSLKKFFMIQMFQAMFELSAKRNELVKRRSQEEVEYEQFFKVSSVKRSTVFLKEVLELSVENIQEVYLMQRHQVIENLYNARTELLSGVDRLEGDSQINSILNRREKSLISSYVGGTLKSRDITNVMSVINSSESNTDYYNMKLSESEFLKQLIPERNISRNHHSDVSTQIKSINEDVYPKEKFSFVRKAMNYLNEPLIEI
jgi:DNA-directed RNA polymerase specialized sigma24 family protein